MFLPCDADMIIVESWFIYEGVVITLDNDDEQNGFIKLNDATSKILQRVYAEHAFGPSKANHFSVSLVKGEEKAFWSVQVLLLFGFNTRTNDRLPGKFAFVRFFEITSSIDSIDHV